MGRSVGIEVNIYRQEPMAYREAWSEKLNFFFFFVNPVGGYFYPPFLGNDFMASAIVSEIPVSWIRNRSI